MKYIKYYFGEDLFEFPLDKHELRLYVKERLSDWDKNSIIDFVVENISDKDLFDIFYDDLHDEYENEAFELSKGDGKK